MSCVSEKTTEEHMIPRTGAFILNALMVSCLSSAEEKRANRSQRVYPARKAESRSMTFVTWRGWRRRTVQNSPAGTVDMHIQNPEERERESVEEGAS